MEVAGFVHPEKPPKKKTKDPRSYKQRRTAKRVNLGLVREWRMAEPGLGAAVLRDNKAGVKLQSTCARYKITKGEYLAALMSEEHRLDDIYKRRDDYLNRDRDQMLIGAGLESVMRGMESEIEFDAARIGVKILQGRGVLLNPAEGGLRGKTTNFNTVVVNSTNEQLAATLADLGNLLRKVGVDPGIEGEVPDHQGRIEAPVGARERQRECIVVASERDQDVRQEVEGEGAAEPVPSPAARPLPEFRFRVPGGGQ